MLELDLEDEAATLGLARLIAAQLRAGDVIGLEGDLGAGKTTFARGVVHGLGVGQEVPVTSPTFALLHQYRGRLAVNHADLYRLHDSTELEELGFDELLEGGSVLLVEWGRRFHSMQERVVLWVELAATSEHGRRVRLTASGARGEAIIDAVRSQYEA